MAVEDLKALSTPELIRQALALARSEPVLQSDEYWARVRTLHRRSGRDAFEAAVNICLDADGISRAVAADVLAQLGAHPGVTEYPFADASEALLVGLLTDPEPWVVTSALSALGHLGRGEPAQLARLIDHPSEAVRGALAYALGGRTDDISIATLIRLSADDDEDTRDWSTFALGSLSEKDSPAIRAALAERLSEANGEIRGEAILGLAVRGDVRAVDPLLHELSLPDVGALAIEAAAAMPRSAFVPHLEALDAANPDDRQIQKALQRCRDAETAR